MTPRVKARELSTDVRQGAAFGSGTNNTTIPERPNSSQQAYRLTEKGYAAVA